MSGFPGRVPALSSSPFGVARLALFVLCLGMTAAILAMNGGKLTYTLDDPYVHLSVSEQLWRGHYGVNAGEFASPSSSILFPFLLTVGAFSPAVHEVVPFLLNLACLFLAFEVLRLFLLRIGFDRDAGTRALAAGLLALAMLCLNMVCLVFTGMEQNLHVALTAAAVLGFVVFLEEDRVAWWFAASLVLLPAVRYEGLALTFAVLPCLALRGHGRWALGIGGVVAAIVGGFSAFLVGHGLPFLPSSVLAKSGPISTVADSAGAGLVSGLQRALAENLSTAAGLLTGAYAALAVAFLWTGWRERRLSDRTLSDRTLSDRTLVAFVLLVFATGQVIVGRFGWWGRYEVYGLVGGAMMSMYLLRAPIDAALASPRQRSRFAAGAVAALLVVGIPYLRLTALSPVSANNIYEQQFQVHRFIVERAKQPVAVADLGFASYRNDHDVFDMLGLGSEEARTSRPPNDLAALDRIVRARGIRIAIFYRDWWLVNQPAHWRCVGVLHLSRLKGSPARAAIDFCATAPEYADELRALLGQFRPDLPAGVRLDILPAS